MNVYNDWLGGILYSICVVLRVTIIDLFLYFFVAAYDKNTTSIRNMSVAHLDYSSDRCKFQTITVTRAPDELQETGLPIVYSNAYANIYIYI